MDHMASILVLDEDRERRDIVPLCLVVAGYENVHVAADGGEALDLIHQSSPDLMVLDVDARGGNGLAFLHLLRSDLSVPRFPIVLISDDADEAELAEVSVAHLKKPLDVKELLEMVSHQLRVAQH